MTTARERLLQRYREVRQQSIAMCEPLEPEDFQVQPSEEVSPPKWNLGHTSWFFSQFILRPWKASLPVDDDYRFYLNSYYHRAGNRGLRGRRGLVTRPTVDQIYAYRRSVDERMERLIANVDERDLERIEFLLTVGANHEQQHQELFYTEIKNIYHANPAPLRAVYRERSEAGQPAGSVPKAVFIPFQGGLQTFGNVEGGWCWDNELEVHEAYLRDFELQNRLVTNGEYLEFMADGGYINSLLWLSDGWAEIERRQWKAPLYWEKRDGVWWNFTLSGMREVDPSEPVCHVSFYEACAYAEWKSQTDAAYKEARLPHEREWECAARVSQAEASEGNFVENGRLHPAPASGGAEHGPIQMLGDVWEWTVSHYEPYPGFKEFPDNLSEYNGKFMNNQRVLRGGSCVTPADHIRVSYRNFWPPVTQFQFTGIRLARDPG